MDASTGGAYNARARVVPQRQSAAKLRLRGLCSVRHCGNLWQNRHSRITMHNRSIFLALAAVLAAAANGAGQGISSNIRSESKESGAELIQQSAHNLFALPG